MKAFLSLLAITAVQSVLGLGFVKSPELKSGAMGWTIDFSVDAATDVTLDLLDTATGRVVRHLGSGLLGANAPLPFTAGTLSQSVAWDGKDDFGTEVANPSALAVRARLGLGMEFSRYVRKAEYPAYNRFDVAGLSVDSNRNLYAVFVKPMNKERWTGHLAVYSPQGKYLRTLLPFPANVDTSKLGGVNLLQSNPGAITPALNHRLCQALVPGLMAAPHMTMDLSIKGDIAMAGGWGLGDAWGSFSERPLVILNKDGTVPRSRMAGPDFKKAGLAHFAFTADGESLYVTGLGRLHAYYAENTDNDFCVYKTGLGMRDTLRVVLGVKGVRGNDSLHFGAPRGLAVDKSGNLYVSDFDNSAVKVYSPSGAYLGGITFTNGDRPAALRVHPSTGAIYVTVWNAQNSGTWYLHEYPGYTGARTARLTIGSYPGSGNVSGSSYYDLAMALDPYGSQAVVYLGGVTKAWSPYCVLRCVDTGAGFTSAEVEDLRRTGIPGQLSLMCADPDNDKVYLAEYMGEYNSAKSSEYSGPDNTFTPWWATYNSGKVIRGLDGFFYGVSPATRDYPDSPNTVGKFWKKNTGGAAVNFSATGAWSQSVDPLATRFNIAKNSQFVGRDGRMAILNYHNAVNDSVTVSLIAPNGNLLREHMVEHMPAAVCIKMDSRGNIYFADNLKPQGSLYPSELSGLPYLFLTPSPRSMEGVYGNIFGNAYGSILKFDSTGGRMRKVASGAAAGPGETLLTEYLTGTVAVSGLNNLFFGMSVVPPSKNSFSACNCMSASFDIDSYDRLFVPDAVQHCVHVLDANFNKITTFGGYDNFDGPGGKGAYPRPEIPLELPMDVAATDKAVYVASYGSRYIFEYTHTTGIVRAEMRYALEYLSKNVVSIERKQAPGTDFRMTAMPNPFNPATLISFSIAPGAALKGYQLAVYNLHGQKVRTLLGRGQGSGTLIGSVRWDGTDDSGRALASGIYCCRLTAAGKTFETRIMKVK